MKFFFKYFNRIIFSFIFIFPAVRGVNSGEFIGFGIHAGLHYDVGNLSDQGNYITYEGQQNIILGVSAKFDRDPFFIRTGADRSFILMEGRVLNNSGGKLEKIKIYYTSIPGYMGINYRIRERGKFYMGAGIAYILGSGSIHTREEKVKIEENIYGIGFLTGVQLRVDNYIQVYAEWEYLSAKGDPRINKDTSKTWKDFGVDFSGHRIHLGLSYYIL